MKFLMFLIMVMASSVFASECVINEKDVCTKETCQELDSNFSFKDGICRNVQSNENKVTDCSAVSGKQGAKDSDGKAASEASETKNTAK